MDVSMYEFDGKVSFIRLVNPETYLAETRLKVKYFLYTEKISAGNSMNEFKFYIYRSIGDRASDLTKLRSAFMYTLQYTM